MKRYQSWGSALLALGFSSLLLLAGTDASAADAPGATTSDTPAILASLDARDVTRLDDRAAMEIRGQGSDYQYVLVRVLGLNTFDFGAGLEWTLNPFGYRYGAFGGPGFTHDSLFAPADAMDALFKGHDLGALSDAMLVAALSQLPNVTNSFWGQIYVPGSITPGSGVPVGTNVYVAGGSLVGGKFYLGWRPMPFTEYSRRQAVTGMQLVNFLR